MNVQVYRLGRFGNYYVDCQHPDTGEWFPWNDEPISQRQARILGRWLRANEPQEG